MTEKLQFAARQALEALEVSTDWDVGAKGKQLESMRAITALREALDHSGEATDMVAEQAEQPVSQEYRDHLVNQSFDWAAMAAKHQFMEGYRIGLAEMREKCAKVCDEWNWSSKHGSNPSGQLAVLAAAIRAIKFEGDTGFRPVSEMIAEHKQDPKKAAAIEKAKMRKAEQKPVAVVEITYGREPECYVTGNIDDFPEGVFKLYAAPVRTKDLTDEEIVRVHGVFNNAVDFARAVIAADRELNK